MSGHTPGDQLDLDAIEREWSPYRDAREVEVILALVAEVRRLRAEVERKAARAERWKARAEESTAALVEMASRSSHSRPSRRKPI